MLQIKRPNDEKYTKPLYFNLGQYEYTKTRRLFFPLLVSVRPSSPSSIAVPSRMQHVRTNEEKIWASDASGYATCAYSTKGDHLYFRGNLNEDERMLSSGHRELLAVCVFQIMIRCKRLNTRTIPIHLLRDDPRINIADDGSKTIDTDDWQVDDQTFQKNRTKFKFTIDLGFRP